MKTSEHARFRRTKKWTQFRKNMLEKYPSCAFCGSKRATKTIHHIYKCETQAEYENLTEDRFIVLCSQCHNFLHWIGRKKNESRFVSAVKQVVSDIGFGNDWINLK